MNGPASPKLLIIEGNIGAGKSTMLKLLGSLLQATIIPEPTEQWQSVNGKENLLELFYKDTKRWAYTFQSYAFLTRIHAILEHQDRALSDNEVHILERSVYCDRYCFAKNSFEGGNMTALEWHIYKEWFCWLVENYAPTPSGFVYLRTTPEVAYKRLVKRDRSEETSIPLSYLQALHNKHEDWLIDKKEVTGHLKNVPVLVLDCDQEFERDSSRQEILADQIQHFIDSLQSSSAPLDNKRRQTHI